MKCRIATSVVAAGLVIAVAPAAMAARAPVSPGGPPPKTSAAAIAAFAKLPDWTGVWQSTGSLFDQTRGDTDANAQHVRDYPPYKPAWEARYEKFLNDVTWQGKVIDPLTLCYPPGFPRLAAVPFGIQFVVRPEQTWIVYERNPVRFIFTDGRQHPSEDDLFPSWEGHSVGHWEGDTLVVDTIGLKGGTLVDRTGLTFSDQLHITERIRRISMNQMEDVLTLDDPVSLTKPWTVRRIYNRVQSAHPDMGNIACAESQRNPIVNGENTVVLGSERPGVTGIYPTEIAPFSVPYGLGPVNPQ
jgi:hypothetical protein